MARLSRLGSSIGSLPDRLGVPPKIADVHYQSPEHKAWRLEVMGRAKWKCQHPGCDKRAPTHRLFADHIVEIKDGGAALDPSNGQVLCGSHHTAKTARVARTRPRG